MKTTVQEWTNPTTRRVKRLRQWIPITLILLLATGLNLYHLGTQSLWIDEFYSIRDAKQLAVTGVRPLYYILLRFWMLFGTSDAWLRGLSVLFGLGSIFLIYRLGRRIAGESTGLIAALLLTLSSLFINHSQEVRMYTLSTFLSLAGTLALTYTLEQPSAVFSRWWAGMRLLGILATPLNVSLLVPDVILVWLRYRKQRRVLFAFAKLLLLIFVLWLPSAFSLAFATPKFMDEWAARLPRPRVFDVMWMLTEFTGWSFRSPLNAITRFGEQFFDFYFFKAYALMLICLLVIALLNKRHPKLIWIAAWGFLPSALILTLSLVSSSVWISRYLLFVCPYFLILLAAGFRRIWHWQRSVAIALALVYAVAVGGGLLQYYTNPGRDEWNKVAQTIAIQEKPSDNIGIIFSNGYREAIEHYYNGSAPIYEITSTEVVTPVEQRSNKLIAERMLDKLPPVKSRLWIVHRQSVSQERNQLIRTTVKEKFNVQQHWIFNWLDLFLVTPHSAPTQVDSPKKADNPEYVGVEN